MNCKLCNSPNVLAVRLIKSPHVDFFYTLFECQDCGSRFFDEREHANVNLEDIYEKLSDPLTRSKKFRFSGY